MSAETTTQLVLVLLGAAVVFAVLGWARNGRDVGPPLALTAAASAAVVAATADDLASGRWATTVLVVLAGALAVAGGGPLTTRIFAIIDRHDDREPTTPPQQTLDQAGQVLRGGAWIGGLERLAVFAGLAAGFPEGVAVVLALKGVGRFQDLRGDGGAATERFIIGTFASVLWAAGCAGVVALTVR